MSRVGVACLISILSVGLLQFVLQVPERQVAHSSSCTTQVEDGTHPEAQHRGAVLCGRLTVEEHIPG